MSIKTRTIRSGAIAIIELKGSLVDVEEIDMLKGAVADFLEQGNKRLVIGLAKVTYINSSGVGALISAHTSYRKNGGEVLLAGLTGPVQNLLTITRLVDVFDVAETVDEAIEQIDLKRTIPT
jgi:anti-sigma B factor antagonist